LRIPIRYLARAIPMQRMISSLARDFIAPKMCSIRHRILDFFRLLAFCSSVNGFILTHLSQSFGS
jgi:hypothetical protein